MQHLSLSSLPLNLLILIFEHLCLYDRLSLQRVSRALSHAARHPRLFDPYVHSAKLSWRTQFTDKNDVFLTEKKCDTNNAEEPTCDTFAEVTRTQLTDRNDEADLFAEKSEKKVEKETAEAPDRNSASENVPENDWNSPKTSLDGWDEWTGVNEAKDFFSSKNDNNSNNNSKGGNNSTITSSSVAGNNSNYFIINNSNINSMSNGGNNSNNSNIIILRNFSQQQRMIASFDSVFRNGPNELHLRTYALFVLPPIDLLEMQQMMRDSPGKCLAKLFDATNHPKTLEEHLLLKTQLVTNVFLMQSWLPAQLKWAASIDGLRMLHCNRISPSQIGLFTVRILELLSSKVGRQFFEQGGTYDFLSSISSEEEQYLVLILISRDTVKKRLPYVSSLVVQLSKILHSNFVRHLRLVDFGVMSLSHVEAVVQHNGFEIIRADFERFGLERFSAIPQDCIIGAVEEINRGNLTMQQILDMGFKRLRVYLECAKDLLIDSGFCTLFQWIETPVNLLQVVVSPAALDCLAGGILCYGEIVQVQADKMDDFLAEMCAAINASRADAWQAQIQSNYQQQLEEKKRTAKK